MRECLEYIYKCVNENPFMSEDELYGVLINSKFFRKLGYKRFGKDVRAQRVVPGKRKKLIMFVVMNIKMQFLYWRRKSLLIER